MTRKALGLVSALALAAAMGLSACSTTTGGSAMTPPAIAPAPGPEAVDVHTHARPEIARVVDVALDLTACSVRSDSVKLSESEWGSDQDHRSYYHRRLYLDSIGGAYTIMVLIVV